MYDRHVERLRGELGLKSAAEVGLVVDSFYKRGASCGVGGVVYTISEDALEGYGEEAALGYLAGAAVRSWYGDSFSFANADDKADVVADLLFRHECTDVQVCRYHGPVPTGYEVRCKLSAAMQKLIANAVAEREQVAPPSADGAEPASVPSRNAP